jgi:hypothetical protein
MKNTLLIIALFIGLGNLNAQDASNVATWEETIGFLKKYESKITAYGCDKVYLHIVNGKIQYGIGNRKVLGERYYHIVDLSKLMSVKEDGENSIGLYMSGNYSISKGNFDEPLELHDFNRIYVCDKELNPRIFKAFQHLTYLATEKRIAEAKSSGDKF